MLKAGANTEHKEANGRTALMIASEHKRGSCVTLLNASATPWPEHCDLLSWRDREWAWQVYKVGVRIDWMFGGGLMDSWRHIVMALVVERGCARACSR